MPAGQITPEVNGMMRVIMPIRMVVSVTACEGG
jgi:hypothetical protein